MRFEKTANDTASTGWISTAEVFLAEALVILIAAGALAANLSRSEETREGLTTTIGAMTDQAAQQAVALKAEQDRLAGATTDLLRTRGELEASKSNEQQTAATLAKLQSEFMALTLRFDASALEVDRLTVDLNIATAKHKAADTKVALLSVANQQLTTELKQAEVAVANLKDTLNASESTVRTLNEQLVTAQKDLKSAEIEVKNTKAKLATTEAQKEDLAKQITAIKKQFAGLTISQADWDKQVKELQGQLNDARLGQGRVRQELLGLEGKFGRVVILFDRSGSMADRWDHTREIVGRWIKYLQMAECVLVTFGNKAEAYPTDGSFLRLDGEMADANRNQFAAVLAKTKPDGLTNTLEAFEVAFKYDKVDTIVLFTDGEPRSAATVQDPKSGSFMDTDMRDKIYKLIEQKKVPVNVVGLGNFYNNKDLAEFLIAIKDKTKGSFMGR